jgi:predicted  nucleic acid-binding Zn-ribbon protein
MSEPDKYSNAWYRKQFDGVNHGLNRTLADYEASWSAVKAMRERIERIESMVSAELKKGREEIGRLNDEIAELKESMAKAREVFRELKNQKGTS